MKNPNRSRGQKRNKLQNRIIRVHTEGETERDYLKIWNLQNKKIRLKFGSRGSPLKLVKDAIKDISKPPSGENDYDEIWCVFDKNTHPDFEKAVLKANTHDIPTAISNPCFELWLLLHYQDQKGFIASKEIQKLAEQLPIMDGKRIRAGSSSTVINNYDEAKKRAKHLAEQHKQNGKPESSNPSSNVWELVERLKPESKNSTP